MKALGIFIFISAFSVRLFCQDLERDAAFWMSVEAEKKINKDLTLSLKHQNRFNNNISNYGLAYVDLGATYKLHKLIRINAGARFGSSDLLTEYQSARTRAYVCLILKYSIRQLNFSYRNQTQFQIVTNSEEQTEWYNRNRLAISYELNRRLEPSLSAELYTPLNQNEGIHPDRIRFVAGTNIKLNKHLNLEPYFLFQHKYYYYSPLRQDYVYGLNLSYSF